MCHNGEINTLRGNKNWMRARQGLLRSPYLGDDTAKLLPVTSDEMSDSGNFDGVLQLLTNESEKSLPEAAMIMVPEAWQDNDGLSESKKAFYEYHSCLMEPWDGPALIAFTDSHKWIGATLDRNGLRPARYYVTHDDRVLVSSEVGVIPWVTPDEIKLRSRLEPGKMFLVDLESGRVVPDSEIKETVAAAKPYGEWLAENRVFLSDWAKLQKPVEPAADFDDATTARRLVMHGYTTETMETLLAPMAIGGKEGFGSMGNDAALAVLSAEPRPVSDYFKQLFAQVTNPPIDPIREELVMSLVCPVGPESNLLDAGAENCARLVVEHPVLTPEELAALQDDGNRDGWSCATVDATFPRHGADLPPPDDANASSSDVALEAALASICEQAAAAVQGGLGRPGATILVLSDVLAGPDRLPVPTLLAVGAVHQHLLKTGQRGKAALFADAGDVKEVHDVALAVGFGADGVCPRVAYEALAKLNADGLVAARMRNDLKTLDDAPDDAELRKAYRKALAKGLLKVMSKMGISTLQSRGGRAGTSSRRTRSRPLVARAVRRRIRKIRRGRSAGIVEGTRRRRKIRRGRSAGIVEGTVNGQRSSRVEKNVCRSSRRANAGTRARRSSRRWASTPTSSRRASRARRRASAARTSTRSSATSSRCATTERKPFAVRAHSAFERITPAWPTLQHRKRSASLAGVHRKRPQARPRVGRGDQKAPDRQGRRLDERDARRRAPAAQPGPVPLPERRRAPPQHARGHDGVTNRDEGEFEGHVPPVLRRRRRRERQVDAAGHFTVAARGAREGPRGGFDAGRDRAGQRNREALRDGRHVAGVH